MTPGRRRPVGAVDTIWLNMDRPNNLMVIESLVFLESAPDFDAVVEVLRDRVLARFPVFRQRPVAASLPWQRPHWEDDPDFAVERHVRRVVLPPPGDDAALQAHVESRLDQPLDRAHPLWEVHLVEGYAGGAALLFRAHHALADGIALTRVLLSMTDRAPGGGGEEALAAAGAGGEHAAYPSIVVDAARLARRATRPWALLDLLGLGVRTTAVVADLLLTHTPRSAVSGTPGPAKRVVWSPPFPLEDVKAAGRMAGATVNDVLMSAVAGALETYQEAHGQTATDLVTMVPVNLRPLDEPLPKELGNAFALVFFTYPSSLAAPLARLAETKRRMDWLKRSPEAVLTFEIISAIGRTTPTIERHVVDFFANKAIGVTTNVAGPREQRWFAGVPVTGVLGWVPGSGTHTVGVCIFTYAGSVRVGFLVDAAAVPDPEELLAAFEVEVSTLASFAEVDVKARKGGRDAHGPQPAERRGRGAGGGRAGAAARRRKPA